MAAAGDKGDYDTDAVCLTPEQVREIAELGLRVEEHWGIPVDIEWGLAEGRFALLQCRAIRGLDITRDVEVGRKEEIERLRGMSGRAQRRTPDRFQQARTVSHKRGSAQSRKAEPLLTRRVWVTHNLGETLRAPTPLTWDIVRHFMSGDGGFGRMYQDLGYRPAPVVRTEGFLELICGRIYADPERQAQLFYEQGKRI